MSHVCTSWQTGIENPRQLAATHVCRAKSRSRGAGRLAGGQSAKAMRRMGREEGRSESMVRSSDRCNGEAWGWVGRGMIRDEKE